jgi:hypothetical protein
MLQLFAICLADDPAIHFNLRTSLIFRMDNLLPAMVTPLSFYPGVLQAGFGFIQRHFTSERGGRDHRNGWPESTVMGGRDRA